MLSHQKACLTSLLSKSSRQSLLGYLGGFLSKIWLNSSLETAASHPLSCSGKKCGKQNNYNKGKEEVKLFFPTEQQLNWTATTPTELQATAPTEQQLNSSRSWIICYHWSWFEQLKGKYQNSACWLLQESCRLMWACVHSLLSTQLKILNSYFSWEVTVCSSWKANHFWRVSKMSKQEVHTEECLSLFTGWIHTSGAIIVSFQV